MFKLPRYTKTKIKINKQYDEGERIEQKIKRIMNNKEPISDGAPLIFQERESGVQPDYDPRTDKWEMALDATDRIQREKIKERSNKPHRQKPEKLPEIGKPGEQGNAEGASA